MKNLAKQLPVLAILAVIGLRPAAATAGSTSVSGNFENSYSKREMSPVIDSAGPILMLTEATGTNTDTSGMAFMPGFSDNVKELAELTRGNGPQNGYVTFSNGQDSVVTKYTGQVTTTMKDDNTPNTTMQGKWQYVSGTGKYQGIKGDGSYKGYFLSQDKYHVDWKGYYNLDASAASNH